MLMCSSFWESPTEIWGRKSGIKAGDRLDFDGGVQVIVAKGDGDITSDGGEGLKVGKLQDELRHRGSCDEAGEITLQCSSKTCNSKSQKN